MVWTRVGGLLILCLAAGCAGKERAPELDPPWVASQEKLAAPAARPPVEKAAADPAPGPAAVVPEPVAIKPAPPSAAPPATVAAAPVAVKPDSTAAPSGTVTAPPAAVKPEVPVVKPETPVARPAAPVEKPAVKAPAPPAPKKEAAAPAPPRSAPATLDLASLEKRLKETSAIGVFTKLTLKNQVDDLISQFRAYYGGQAKTTLAALRQPYDQLLLKVLSLLQDSDPPLARAIADSREAIWGILSNPEKFKNL